jgi:hypothetical protein
LSITDELFRLRQSEEQTVEEVEGKVRELRAKIESSL